MSGNIFKDGIDIPKVVKKLELSNYHEELKGKFIMVWVNLTRQSHQDYADIQAKLGVWSNEGKQILEGLAKQVEEAKEAEKSKKEIEKIRKKNEKLFDEHMKTIASANDEMYAWYSEIFSQHKNEVHHCTPEEVRKIAETSLEQDNGSFWGWISNRTNAMIVQHGNQQLKK